MSDTMNDITVPSTTWVSANTLTGMALGTAMTIQPKGGNILIKTIALQPAASDMNGIVLVPLVMYAVSSGEQQVWLKSLNYSSSVSVQQGV